MRSYQPGYEVLKKFACWQNKAKGALFAKGDSVFYKGVLRKVDGVNVIDEGDVEYLIENVDVAVYESELKHASRQSR